tara:strand:- start:255 stop:458 length:204 start_codon:yes stop_codon:yes gene_type:complete
MKIGDLVSYNRQHDYCFGAEEYGVGLIISHIDIDEFLQPASKFLVYWPNYIHGSTECEHDRMELTKL